MSSSSASSSEAGNFLPVDPTPATIESGQTPVVIDWNYLNAAETKKLPSLAGAWCRRTHAVAGYYYQAINKDAPHPAAARLWQEFLYSDEGQNLFAVGGVRPVRADTMMTDGTLDKAVAAQLPVIDGPVTVPTPAADRQGHRSICRRTGPRRSADVPGVRLRTRLREALPLLPFLAVVVIFLVIPTVTVIVSAFVADGAFSLARIEALFSGDRAGGVVEERAALGQHRGHRRGARCACWPG